MFQGSILLHLPPALNRLRSSEKIMLHILCDIMALIVLTLTTLNAGGVLPFDALQGSKPRPSSQELS